ncbi:MAG: hypothetical protein GY737_02380 [Desulfobacteraceae bacterium]|nr:hypothetical protein [Desulfobacteraceae bacterium]
MSAGPSAFVAGQGWPGNVRELEDALIQGILSLSGGNVTKAAKRCKLERQALRQIMKRFKISADKFSYHPEEINFLSFYQVKRIGGVLKKIPPALRRGVLRDHGR